MPCREEVPFIITAYHQYKNKGFTVLGISIDDIKNKAAWLNAIKSDDTTWTQLLDDSRKVKTIYGITTIPANILIDPNGKIIARNLKDKVLTDKLNEVLTK